MATNGKWDEVCTRFLVQGALVRFDSNLTKMIWLQLFQKLKISSYDKYFVKT